MSTPDLNPQQARIAALNRLKARDKFAAQSSSSVPNGQAGQGANGAGTSRNGGAGPSLVNKAQAGPANSRDAVKGQEVEAPLKRDSSLVCPVCAGGGN